ncbi:MAG: amidotransferase [Halothiobacillaceae bacterium]|nr:amidotransferase [Halothiobacillaceae bacterium]
MKVLAFQHESFEGLGAMAPWFAARNIAVQMVPQFLPSAAALPAPDALDFLIVLGGPMGVHDTEQHPWLIAEKAYIGQCLALNKPVLGICLGAQLIAEQLGAVVQKNHQPEIGWWLIDWLPAAQRIWPEAMGSQTVFHWHGDTFGLPAEAQLLAKSAACGHQGFVYQSKVVGLQFHLEMTEHTVNDLIEHGADELIEAPFVAGAAEIQAEPPQSYQKNQHLMAQLLSYLLDGSPGG